MDIERSKIEAVDESDRWWSIRTEDSSGFGLDKKYGVTPKVGDIVDVECVRGSTIRSITINGNLIFYKTDEDLEEEHKAMVEKMHMEKQEQFEKDKLDLDAKYESLPLVFQLRFDRFRTGNSNFRWEYESYEMFCCQEALKIARHCRTAKRVQEFKQRDNHDEAMEVISDQHSGNTFGAACMLAYWYLECPDIIEFLHGSLVPLVGCEEFGCTHSDTERKVVESICEEYERKKNSPDSKLRKLLVIE